MKITGITATLFRDISVPTSEACLVELHSDCGLKGVAIATPWARETILSLAKDLLMGTDPCAVTAFWQRSGLGLGGRANGALPHARAVLDVACWDLKAKAQAEPLWKTLGGSRPRANAYFSCSLVDNGSIDIGRLEQAVATGGMRGGKLTAGTDPELNQRNLGLLKQALSGATHEPQLMINAGGRWRPKEAVRHLRALESKHDLTWVQGVAEPGDFLGSRQVSNSIRAAVCAGAELSSTNAFLPYLHHHAANVIEIDMHHFGITGSMQLSDAAYGFELPVTLRAAPGNIHAHLAAVMPYFMSMEVVSPAAENGPISSGVSFQSGWGIAGDAAGTGLVVKTARLGEGPQEFTA